MGIKQEWRSWRSWMEYKREQRENALQEEIVNVIQGTRDPVISDCYVARQIIQRVRDHDRAEGK